MKIGKTLIFTRDYMEEINETDKYTAYGNFLDRFRFASKEVQQILIEERPLNDEEHPIDMARLAASVEVLVKEYDLEMPDWVMDPKYYLKEPFDDNTTIPGYKKLLRETAIPEFAKRNLFLGDNCMDRY